VNDTAWWRSEAFGASCTFEPADGPQESRFPEVGLNIHVVWPGQSNCMYHGESTQEDFLVPPVSEVAQKHGSGVEVETTRSAEAYARFPRWERGRPPEAGLPWQ
jgi:hypothetical protein